MNAANWFVALVLTGGGVIFLDAKVRAARHWYRRGGHRK